MINSGGLDTITGAPSLFRFALHDEKYSEHSFGPDVIASGRAKTIFGMGRRRKNFGLEV